MSSEEFAKHVEPLADALSALVLEARADRAEVSVQAADSPAMAEWAAQLMFPDSDEGAIDVARTLS